MKHFENVDMYIASAPKDLQPKLRELRKLIKKIAPAAVEKISYGMPYYEYHGSLAYFAFAKKHIGLYIPPPIIEDFKNEVKAYKTAKAIIQFPLDQKLPILLIKRLIKARVKFNEKSKSR